MSNMPKSVPCPTCKKKVLLNRENPFRPFCCHRCQLMDLGAWAQESYKIPTEESASSDMFDDPSHKDDSD